MAGAAQVHSTGEVETARAFEYWRDLICDTFVELAATPVDDRAFSGAIALARFDGLDVSTVSAGAQRVRRTPALIRRSDEAFLLASIQTHGRGLVVQDGRSAALTPGSMAFYDSTRPYTLHFDDPFEQIVVQVPLDHAMTLAGTRRPLEVTARVLAADGAAGAVAQFFRSLTVAHRNDPDGAAQLAGAGAVLFASALSLVGGDTPADGGVGLRREEVRRHLRRHLDDPDLDAAAVAAALHVSRRTLYRIVADDDGGVMGLLRRLRVDHARHLLTASPSLPVHVVAARCGFAGPVQFHRTFRAAVGLTPGEYRERARGGRADGTARQ